ncbi:hypothetical protein Q3G72_002454 [Acer saccharum]|nr:hypothetical protein Q3G72_002454 [Acer saccharum]
MSWVEVYGVPLSCWSKDVFKKLGDLVGEFLWIDEVTESRQRMDIGRMIVQAPMGKSLSREVTVKLGNRAFPVKMIEQKEPVTFGWLSSQLKLKSTGLNFKCSSRKVVDDQDWAMAREKTISVERCRHDRSRVGVVEDVAVNTCEKKDKRTVRDLVMRRHKQQGEAMGESAVEVEKGKRCWILRKRSIVRAPHCNGSVRIMDQWQPNMKKRWEESDSSSYSSGPVVGP